MTIQSEFNIGEINVGSGHPTFIIAEVGQAHDGSLGTAHAYIEAAAKAGVSAIKFQTHIASAESTALEKFRVSNFPQDKTRFDYWKRMEFSAAEWKGLAAHANDLGLVFLSTPFSFEAVDLLEDIGVPAWKIGSGETSNIPMIEYMADTGKPILFSTGLSSWNEISHVAELLDKKSAPFAIFQCTSSYPCQPDQVGLNVIEELKEKFSCPIGLSDHSGSIFPSIAAVALGAKILELHIVFSRSCHGPDVSASVTIEEFSELVRAIRLVEVIMRNPVDKDIEALNRKEMSVLFGKSLYAKHALVKGQVLSSEDIALKKPGSGIPAKRLDEVLGKKIRRAYALDEQIKNEDLYE